MKILAVDDDDYILELLPMIAADSGWDVVEIASSGLAALDMIGAAAQAYDCILLDIQMPGMDGIELCRRIRALPGYARTPVIMLTAMGEKKFIDRAFEAGATDYATKPFDVIELGARLRVARELVQARREARPPLDPEEEGDADEIDPLDLADELQWGGVRNLLHLESLRNYLAQLSRAGLNASLIVGVKIDDFDVLAARSTRAGVMRSLTQVAAAIDWTFRPYGFLMSYAGNGVYVCVSNGSDSLLQRDLETSIQTVLDVDGLASEGDRTRAVEVSVGAPFRPGTEGPTDVGHALKRAVLRAELRAEEKAEEPRPPNIRFSHAPW